MAEQETRTTQETQGMQETQGTQAGNTGDVKVDITPDQINKLVDELETLRREKDELLQFAQAVSPVLELIENDQDIQKMIEQKIGGNGQIDNSQDNTTNQDSNYLNEIQSLKNELDILKGLVGTVAVSNQLEEVKKYHSSQFPEVALDEEEIINVAKKLANGVPDEAIPLAYKSVMFDKLQPLIVNMAEKLVKKGGLVNALRPGNISAPTKKEAPKNEAELWERVRRRLYE